MTTTTKPTLRRRVRTDWAYEDRQTGRGFRRIKNWRFSKSGLTSFGTMGTPDRDDGMQFTLRTPEGRRSPKQLKAFEAKVVAAIEAILEEEA